MFGGCVHMHLIFVHTVFTTIMEEKGVCKMTYGWYN
jgi:hypothetical protein